MSLWEAPDNMSMTAVGLAISGGGALSSFETTVLLTVDETRAFEGFRGPLGVKIEPSPLNLVNALRGSTRRDA
jgi:hypothetical protein